MNYGGNLAISPPPMAEGAALALLAGLGIFYFVIFLVFYLYFGICYMQIAKKTQTPNTWWAWIPILNILLFVKIAGKPWWWVLLLLIPLVNIIISIILWMEVAKKRGKPDWVGILIIVPVVGFFIPAYLAFS